MPVDSLARLLGELVEKGSIPASRVSARMEAGLEQLFDQGVLERRRSGAGFRIHVVDTLSLNTFIKTRYRHGLEGLDSSDLPPKAAAIANLGDSKRGRGHGTSFVMMRGFGDLVLTSPTSPDADFPVAELTGKFQLAALCIDDESDWTVEAGKIALVENFESFLHVERVLIDVDIAVYTSGVLPQLILSWLQRSFPPSVSFIHFADYDPKGLSEFERAYRYLNDRLEFYLPQNFETLLREYGKPKLLRDSAALFERLRMSELEVVRHVANILLQHGKGLEQEALLI